MRLARMRRLASSVQRWLIDSPIRLTTRSTPSSASAGGRSSVGFQACQVTFGLVECARAGSRVNPTTSSPRASSASQTDEPIIPLAPVTRTFTTTGFALGPTSNSPPTPTNMTATSQSPRSRAPPDARRHHSIASRSLDRREAAGLLGDAGDAGVAGLVNDRLCDRGGDVAVEHARDDVRL